jgi:hypothetical protein
LDRPERDFDSECSGEDGASEAASESSIRHTTASGLGGVTTDLMKGLSNLFLCLGWRGKLS